MDKNEYNLKLQEIKKLVEQGNYAAAAAAADQVDWKRVRNVRTLCLISEIYEAEGRYEDSKEILVRAYKRSPVGRSILYRLVEVTIKLKQFDEAIEYYSEYVQAAPNDTSKYVLKYKIYRGRGSSVDEQIQILKEYLDQEYNEEYAYELAKLYQEADRIQECLATCDDLVLWFHSGKYVIKALELKKRYASLTPKQQEIYDHRFDEPEEDEFSGIGREKQMVSDASVSSAATEIMEDAQRSIASEIAGTTLAETAGGAEEAEPDAAAEGTRILPDVRKALRENTERDEVFSEGVPEGTRILPDVRKALREAAENENSASGTGPDPAGFTADSDLQEDEPAQTDAAETSGETDGAEVQGGAQTPDPDIRPEEERKDMAAGTSEEDAQGAMPASVSPQQQMNTLELQTEMIKSMREIVSGVGLRNLVDEEEAAADHLIEEAKKAQEVSDPAPAGSETAGGAYSMRRKLTMPELEKKRDAGQLSIDDILLSMGERGAAVREAASKVTPPVKPGPEGVLSAVDEALLNMGISPEIPEPKPEKPLDELFRQDPPAEEIAPAQDFPAEENAPVQGSPAEEDVSAPDYPAQEDVPVQHAAAEEETDHDMARDDILTEGMITAEEKTVPENGIQENEAADETGRTETHLPEGSSLSEEMMQTEQDGKEDALPESMADRGFSPADPAIQGTEEPEQAGAALTGEKEAPAPEEWPETGEDDDIRIAQPPVHKATEAYEDPSLETPPDRQTADGENSNDASQNLTMDEIINAKTRRIPSEEIARRRGKIAPELRGTPDGPWQRDENAEELQGQEEGKSPSENAKGEGEAPAGAGPETAAPGKEAAAGEGAAAERPAAPMWVKPQLRGFFDGYLEVRDMDRQINEAIGQAMAKGNDRTSRSGNILIFGGHGCGKTTIATGLAKAIARERGQNSVKMARIYATDLNRKDIAATIAKISGGVLIIEEAGDLEDGIADQLTTAMEFRTDGLIIILEDEQRYMHDLLMRHPRMTMKFTSQIYIPPFTPQDLVRFGALYADDRDYALSEGAAAALQSRIEKLAQTMDGPMSITASLDLVDAAIVRANKFGRKLFSGKKRYDSEGRVVLLEKDIR